MYPNSKILAVASGNLWEKIVRWYQTSWLSDAIGFVSDELFGMDFGVYENFTLGSDTAGTVRQVIIGFLLGMIIAAVCYSYIKLVHGRFIRTLLRLGCHSPETAITLREAGVFRDPSIRRDLLRGGALAKLTKCVEAEAALAADSDVPAEDAGSNTFAGGEAGVGKVADAAIAEGADQTALKSAEPTGGEAVAKTERAAKRDFVPDFLTARYYIPEELKYRAEFRYDRKGVGLPQFLLTVVLSIVAAILLCRCVPALIAAADWLMSVLAP